jgi:Ca-activated chloride channel family protein
MFNFSTPLAFILLIPWAIAAWRLYRTGNKSGVLFAPAARLPANTAGWRVAIARLLPALFLLAALLLIIAVARPRTTLTREQRSVNAIAIEMIVDVSGSMEALDLSPGLDKTRLDVVKDMFSTFIRKRPDDLIGLVTFGGYASTRAPLTPDHRALAHVLSGVEIPKNRLDEQGRPVDQEETMTAIGDGLSTGLARLQDAEPKTRIVILLSDGESNTGIIQPDQAAAAAAKLGIRVYTIGVGSHNNRTPFRTRDIFGRQSVGYMNLAFNEPQLKSISEKTQARYFNVRDNEGLKRALEEISKLETTQIKRDIYERYNEHFVDYLLWGAGLIVLAITLHMALTRRLL